MATSSTLVRSQVKTAAGPIRQSIAFDADAFMASLVAAVKTLEVTTTAQLWALALRIQNNARILAPVDTGRLRASIMATKGSDGLGPFVEIGTNVEYAAYVEFGTRYMAAQPYLRPAIAIGVTQWGAGLGVAGGVG